MSDTQNPAPAPAPAPTVTPTPPGSFDPALEGNYIPPAIRKQAERSARLMREATAASTDGNSQPPPAEARPVPPTNDQGGPAAAQPGPTVHQEGQTPPPSPPAPSPQPGTDWEQRYRSLQGKYDAEVGQVAQRAREAEARVAQLQYQLDQANLRQMPAAPARQPAAAEIPAEDIEAYGAELPEAARRWARAEVAPEMAEMRRELDQLRGTTTQVTQQTAHERVYSHLDAKVDGWRAVNEDAAFLSWLEGPDDLSGYPRKVLLGNAFNAGDAQRTAKIFLAFREISGKDRSQSEHTAAGQSAPASSQTPQGAGVRLQDLAAPGRGSPASPGAPAEKRTWSPKQIEALYRDKTRGVFAGREAEFAALDADINAAMLEGRIIG